MDRYKPTFIFFVVRSIKFHHPKMKEKETRQKKM